MTKYIIRNHRGRSWRSIYQWRVYAERQFRGNTSEQQLGKFRSRESAGAFVDALRRNAKRVEERRNLFDSRKADVEPSAA